ncbi:arginine--tRNA ligase, cytoplasmic-like isoform X1 [Senna tora]|uniref:Arginine--tRNA ligase, cytoplasmic-like isoform X1 n=1 Tax=Senna tora TaxID=362788 RepID=A0A834SCQ2_9FABA|nr:arginine--tRNA ligase, cytoplasmic-like isoform X1 [Senna tora]
MNFPCSAAQTANDSEQRLKVGKIALDHDNERTLGLHLLQFSEVFNGFLDHKGTS